MTDSFVVKIGLFVVEVASIVAKFGSSVVKAETFAAVVVPSVVLAASYVEHSVDLIYSKYSL
jgi:hypothetical protein